VSVIDLMIEQLGPDRQLVAVTDGEVGDVLEELWGEAAASTWNRNRAAAKSWLEWCRTRKHWTAPTIPADAGVEESRNSRWR
jgi:hypothetical protein